MADWSLIESTLQTWVQDITGLTAFYRRRPRAPIFSNDGYALIDVTGRASVGQQDDLEFVYDSGQAQGSEIRYYQSGQRTFTFSVQIRTQRESVDQDAKHYTSLIRDSLRLPQRSLEVFNGAEIAFASILSETDFEEVLDGRDLSIAQIDIRFNAYASTEDTATGYIATLDDADLQIPEGTSVWTGDIDL